MPAADAYKSLVPPDEMLSKIQSEETEFSFLLFAVPTPGREKIPGTNKYEMEEWIAFVFSALRKYYSSKFGQSKEFNSQFAGEIFGEALFNAVGHGNRFHPEKLTKLGVWLGSKGTIFAIEDEGNFFKDESIKNKILSRSHIKSTATQETGGGGTGG